MEVGFPEFFLSSGENYFANKCHALGASYPDARNELC